MKRHPENREGPEGQDNTSGGDFGTTRPSHAAKATALNAPAGRRIITDTSDSAVGRIDTGGHSRAIPRNRPNANTLATVQRTFPLLGSDEVFMFDCYVTPNPFWDYPMVAKGWLTTKEAAARWGVTEKTLYAVIPELEELGIRLPGARVRLDAELFHALWLYGAPERRTRAETLATRDQRRIREGVGRLQPGRRKKDHRQQILASLGRTGASRRPRLTMTEAMIERMVTRGADRHQLLERYASQIAEDRKARNYVE